MTEIIATPYIPTDADEAAYAADVAAEAAEAAIGSAPWFSADFRREMNAQAFEDLGIVLVSDWDALEAELLADARDDDAAALAASEMAQLEDCGTWDEDGCGDLFGW